MKTIFRFPGSAEYAFAELHTTEGSVFDNARELRDVDPNFLTEVGRVLQDGCTMVALGPLKPQVVEQNGPQQWNDTASAPQWAQNGSQEAQGYTSAPQQAYAPQAAPQGYTQHVPTQQYPAPQQPMSPPGQQPPVCQRHGQAATYKPGGTSRTTGRPYDAFWACSANDRDCTKASNFPKP